MEKNTNKKSLKKVNDYDNGCFMTETLLHQKQENDKKSMVFDFNKKYTVIFVTACEFKNIGAEYKTEGKVANLKLKDVIEVLKNLVEDDLTKNRDEKLVYLKISENEVVNKNAG